MKKIAAGLGALLLLAILLLGIPAALVLFAGNPIPSGEVLQRGLTQPDWSGSFITGYALPLIGWIAWAWMAIGILSVIPSMLRQVEPPQLPAFSLGQSTGRALIGAVLAMATLSGGAVAATAAEPLHQTQATTVAASTITPGAELRHAAVKQQAPAAVENKLPSVTVKDGDSLWSLAEAHLGDGNRFGEILKLNLGASQPDGGTLGTDQYIHSGWELKLPKDANVEADRTVIAKAGQDLGTIAKDVYGDASKAQTIFNASQSIVQADGTQLGVTGAVRAGDRLIAPDAIEPAAALPKAPAVSAPAPAVQAPVVAPESKTAPAIPAPQPAQEVHTPAAKAPVAETSAEGQASDAVEDVTDHGEDTDFPVNTLWGAGGILAAGLLAFLGARRLQQQRSRKVGQRIAMPENDAAATEHELRAVEDQAGVDDIDMALHWIATWAHENDVELPKLFAVRLSSTVEVFLQEPADLPAPFEATSEDRSAWQVDPTKLPVFDPKTAAPFPALVTLGVDPADGYILVDLEQIGALALTGDPEQTSGALTAIAIELAASKWAEDLTITLVGCRPELAETFDTGRIRWVPDLQDLLTRLEARVGKDVELLERLGYAGTQDARVNGDGADSWPPEVVLLDQTPSGEEAQRLAELVNKLPRVGLAAVAPGAVTGDWALEIGEDREAVLQPAGIPLAAQIVDEDSYQDILAALRTTQDAPVAAEPAPAPEHPVVITEPEHLPEVPEVNELEDAADEAEAGTEVIPVQEAPAKLVEIGSRSQRRRPPRGTKVTINLPDAPLIHVLGPVKVEGAKGVNPSQLKGVSEARMKEIVTFLALNGPATTEEYDAAIHPNLVMTAAKRNPNISRARRWLGEAADGAKYLPEYAAHEDYRCTAVTTWGLFQELIGSNVRSTPDEALEAAMELVHGMPFQGVRTGTRGAWAWAEPLQQDIVSAISDAAFELGERALDDGDPQLLLKAATRGILASPATEDHRRHKLIAHSMLGDLDGFNQAVKALHEQCEAMEAEPAVETEELIERLRARFERGAA